MKKVLVIQSSLSGEQGQSNQLIEHLLSQGEGKITLDVHDLVKQPLSHLTMADLIAWNSAETTEAQAVAKAESNDAIAALKQADVVVIGVPMYNFAIPSQLKAWLDRIVRAGVTFQYTEQGPVGLIDNKPVVLVATRGGAYAGTAADTQTPYLTQVLNFIGLTDLHFVYAEKLNMGEPATELSAAKHHLSDLAARLF